ncbi:MAG: BatA domain-containing protein [Clostridiales bacterium]|nr:BatA domain-containing protein [Clostridiales bacterium]
MILQWLVPLGFLGLIGIGLLLIIYIIKPKYNRRLLPSTFMWIRSKKFRRKRLPLDPFRDIFIFIMQALAIAACAIIIASPYFISEQTIKQTNEQIIVIESSASMRSKLIKKNGETRFKRAIDSTKKDVDDILMRKGGSISVIIADTEPYFIVESADRHSYSEVIAALDAAECSYGTANLSKAMELAEDRVLTNPTAKITVYSGKELGYMGDAVTSVCLADPDNEWNIGIYECTPSFVDNEFKFVVDVAAYGKVSTDVVLYFEIKGVDDGETTIDLPEMQIPINFNVDENGEQLVEHVRINVDPTDERIGGQSDVIVDNYDEIVVQFRGLNDSLSEDDSLLVYGGKRDRVKIEYYTSDRNIFFPSGITTVEQRFASTREITLTTSIREETLKLSDFDIYMFEHTLPEAMLDYGLPNDGINVLLDPDEDGLEELGFKSNGVVKLSQFTYLSQGTLHPIVNNIDIEQIGVSEYTRIEVDENSGFVPVLYCGDDPVLFVKNWGNFKMMIMAFSVNQSNLVIRPLDFLTFLCNIIDYYMPTTLTEYCFEIGSKTQVNCKGTSLSVQNMRGENVGVFTSFPEVVTFDTLGTYTFTTRFGLNKEDEVRKVYVRTPVSESSLFQMDDLGFRIMNTEYEKEMAQDLFLWFAILVVILLFVEYILQRRSIVGS